MQITTMAATTVPVRLATVCIAQAEQLVSENDINSISEKLKDVLVLATNTAPDRLILENAAKSIARSATVRIVVVNGVNPAIVISASVWQKLRLAAIPNQFRQLIAEIVKFATIKGDFAVIEVEDKFCAQDSSRLTSEAIHSPLTTQIVLEKTKIPESELLALVNSAMEKFNRGDYQDTLPIIRQVTSSRRDITDAFFIQGVTEAKLGLLSEAARSLNAVLEVRADHIEAQSLLTQIQKALGY